MYSSKQTVNLVTVSIEFYIQKCIQLFLNECEVVCIVFKDNEPFKLYAVVGHLINKCSKFTFLIQFCIKNRKLLADHKVTK